MSGNRREDTVLKCWFFSALAAIALTVTGCASADRAGRPAPESSKIDELNLVALPMPVNLSARPGGADGIAVKVYAVNRQRPKAQPIRNGALELLMYDGLLNAGSGDTNRLVHAWSFPASELAAHSFITTVGTGYLFSLRWGSTPPRGNQITVIARHLTPQNSVVSSSPNFIALSPRAPGGE